MKTIIAICGSRRKGSFNTSLLQEAITLIGQDSNVSVNLIDPADMTLPLYEEDVETADGIPDSVTKLHEQMATGSGFLVATPEYNGGYTSLLKNTIDWVSRVDHRVFGNRHVGILTASPGGGGGARAAKQTADLFAGMQANVYDPTFSLPTAHEALSETSIPGLSEWVDGYIEALTNDNSEQ